jgi:hypothetical protein
MLQPNLVASTALLVMLAWCALGIGFMVRFFLALTGEAGKMRRKHQFLRRGVHYATDSASELPRHRWAAADCGVYMVMGVRRVTTALASNRSRASRRTAGRSNVVVFAELAQERDAKLERRYGLS